MSCMTAQSCPPPIVPGQWAAEDEHDRLVPLRTSCMGWALTRWHGGLA